jgi:hypothetical protein
MQTCQYAGDPLTEPRSHPWVDTAGRPECRYHDLTRSPELIRTALEDLVPWSHYPAIETLYGLIERLNGTGSPWESNDCEFTGPQAHTTPGAPHALECSGRLMVLLSALERNTSVADVEHETEHLHRRLAELDPDLRAGVIGTTLLPVRYLGLPGDAEQQRGVQLLISFWAWGETEAGTMRSLDRVLRCLATALLAPTAAGRS